MLARSITWNMEANYLNKSEPTGKIDMLGVSLVGPQAGICHSITNFKILSEFFFPAP